jgi:hypothetical protein
MLKDELSYIDLLKNNKILESDEEDKFIFFSNLFKSKDRILVFKYSSNPIEFVHEAFLGKFFGNKMRQLLPTFTWTYGYTSCNLPFFNKDNQMISACNEKVRLPRKGEKENIGLITEYVEGLNIQDYLSKNISYEQFLSLLLVVFYSLKYANDRFRFVHWDLHHLNIIMRKLDKDNQYIYLPDEKKYIWVGNTLPTIIDFGFSSIEKDDKIYGYLDFIENGINPFYSKSPLNDVLKLIPNIVIMIYNKKSYGGPYSLSVEDLKIISTCEYIINTILGLPTKTNFKQVYNNFLMPTTSIFPNSPNINIEKFSPITIESLIQYLEDLAYQTDPNLILVKKPSKVLSCVGDNCLSETQILDDIFVNENDNITLTQFIRDMTLSKKEYDLFNKILLEYLDNILNDIIQVDEKLERKSDLTLIAVNELRLSDLRLEKIIEITKEMEEFEKVYLKALEIKNKFKDILSKNLENIKNPDKYIENYFKQSFNTHSIKGYSYDQDLIKNLLKRYNLYDTKK